jgi:transcriptional regulator of arginine metabolism
MRGSDKAARQEAIRRIVRTRAVATQEELGQLLADEGYDVTQATLSRDLAQLGAMRVSLPEGGTVYSLDAVPVALSAESRLREMGELVRRIEDNESLVVLFTAPGSASLVAAALDAARLEQCLGTIAGDDTVFVAPSRGTRPRALAQTLRAALGKDEAE